MESDDERRRRAARREFIRTHHPDVGGDPDAFFAGLRRFDAPGAPDRAAVPRLQVRRSKRPDRVVLRVLRRAADRRAGRPRRHLD